MRLIVTLATVALASFGSASAATALDIPRDFLISVTPPDLVARFPAKVEKPSSIERQKDVASLDGAFYAEIFPLYTGSGGNTSFLRFGNLNNAASVFHISVVG